MVSSCCNINGLSCSERLKMAKGRFMARPFPGWAQPKPWPVSQEGGWHNIVTDINDETARYCHKMARRLSAMQTLSDPTCQ